MLYTGFQFIQGSKSVKTGGTNTKVMKTQTSRKMVLLMLIVISCIDAQTYMSGGRHAHDRMVVEFTTTCAISAYHH